MSGRVVTGRRLGIPVELTLTGSGRCLYDIGQVIRPGLLRSGLPGRLR